LKLRHFAAVASVCAFVGSCSTVPSAPPPPPPTPAQILAEASASDFTCARANATTISFEKFALGPQLYVDKCVRVSGLASYRFLVKDATTMPAQKSAAVPSSAFGLYWKDESMRKLDAGPQFVEIVGRIRLCETRNKLEQAAGIPSTAAPCRSAKVAIFVSQSHIFPTAMD
jgi:hypothetical protein